MATRKALVQISGTLSELPAGDTLDGVTGGTVGGEIPFTKASGEQNSIPLTADSKIPFYNAAGTAKNIPLTSDTAPLSWAYYSGLALAQRAALP